MRCFCKCIYICSMAFNKNVSSTIKFLIEIDRQFLLSIHCNKITIYWLIKATIKLLKQKIWKIGKFPLHVFKISTCSILTTAILIQVFGTYVYNNTCQHLAFSSVFEAHWCLSFAPPHTCAFEIRYNLAPSYLVCVLKWNKRKFYMFTNRYFIEDIIWFNIFENISKEK